jgi:magnesium transporter
MIRTILHLSDRDLEWIDVTKPEKAEMAELAERFSLHANALEDCLDPAHLPKFEEMEGVNFIIARVIDRKSPDKAITEQKLTNKVAVFYSDRFLITIHRNEEPLIEKIAARFSSDLQTRNFKVRHVLYALMKEILLSYQKPLLDTFNQIEKYEDSIFNGKTSAFLLHDLYIARRRAGMYRKLIYLMKEVCENLKHPSKSIDTYHQDLKETANSVLVQAEQLNENITHLLNLHISIATMRTNEVMRVLTVFSVFFLPLTFVVGVYGMNFKYMPELESRLGYPLVWLLMVGIILVIFFWFRRKRWI